MHMIICFNANTRNKTHSLPLSLSHASTVRRDDWLLHLTSVSTLVPHHLPPTKIPTSLTPTNFIQNHSKQFPLKHPRKAIQLSSIITAYLKQPKQNCHSVNTNQNPQNRPPLALGSVNFNHWLTNSLFNTTLH